MSAVSWPRFALHSGRNQKGATQGLEGNRQRLLCKSAAEDTRGRFAGTRITSETFKKNLVRGWTGEGFIIRSWHFVSKTRHLCVLKALRVRLCVCVRVCVCTSSGRLIQITHIAKHIGAFPNWEHNKYISPRCARDLRRPRVCATERPSQPVSFISSQNQTCFFLLLKAF